MTLNKENNTLTLQPESLQYIHKLQCHLNQAIIVVLNQV